MKYSVTTTFGLVPDKQASGTTAFETLDLALTNARGTFTQDWGCSVHSVVIRQGDFAPRLSNCEWVAAPETGWEDCQQ